MGRKEGRKRKGKGGGRGKRGTDVNSITSGIVSDIVVFEGGEGGGWRHVRRRRRKLRGAWRQEGGARTIYACFEDNGKVDAQTINVLSVCVSDDSEPIR